MATTISANAFNAAPSNNNSAAREPFGDNKENQKSELSVKETNADGNKKSVLGIFGKFKKLKHKELILAGVAIVIMLAIYFSSGLAFGCGGSSSASAAPPTNENHLQRIERQLNEAFSLIDGAGETQVIINWESGIEQVIAKIVTENQNGTSSAPSIITGGGQQGPIVIKEIYPRAIGVIIVTQGGDNVMLRLSMINAVSTLLDITPDRIQVLTMRR